MTALAPTRTAGRQRFWITVLIFASLNAGAWFAYHHIYQARSRTILRVESFEPGEGQNVSNFGALSWHFNLDVAAPGGGELREAPGTITPAVAGTWRWSDARTLNFYPKATFPSASKFAFELNPARLATPQGFTLPKALTYNVHTTPLTVRDAYQVAIEPGSRVVIQINLNDRVLPADLKNKLKLSDGAGRPIGYQLHSTGVADAPRIITDSLPLAGSDGKIRLRIDSGLAGLSGPAGMPDAWEKEIELTSRLQIRGLRAEAPSRQSPAIYLQCSDNLNVENARQVISVEPAVSFAIAQHYDGLELQGDFAPGTRYAVKIAEPPAGAAPNLFPRSGSLSVFVPDRAANVWFEHNIGYLGQNGNRTVLAKSVNVPELKLSIWRLYDENLTTWQTGRRNLPQLSKPIASKRIKATAARNQEQEHRIDLGELLPPDSNDGVYYISLRDMSERQGRYAEEDEERGYYYYNRSADTTVTLSDIALTAKQERGSVLVWATSLKTAKPLAGVRVRMHSSKNQFLGQAVTDDMGMTRIAHARLPKGETPATVLADTLAGSQLTWLSLHNNEWDLADSEVGGRSYLREGFEAYAWTERGVYRPGETVHLRALVRDPQWRFGSAFPVEWRFLRPDHRKWQSKTTMLGADGSCELSIELPADLVTGRWTAEVSLSGDDAPVLGSAVFFVEEYMPDRMKATVAFTEKPADQPRRFQIGDDDLTAHIQADYLFGRPAAGLETSISARVDPGTFAPKQWGGWSFCDTGKTIDRSGLTKGAVGMGEDRRGSEKITLDAHGHGEWGLGLKEHLKLAGPATAPATRPNEAQFRGPWRVAVRASVQEAGGRAVTAAASIDADVLDWYIGIRRPEQTPAPGATNTFELALVKPDGSAAPDSATVEAILYRANWNTNTIYKDGRYHYESKRSLEAVSSAVAAKAEIRQGRGCVQVTPPTHGEYILRVTDPKTGALSSVEFYASSGGLWTDQIDRKNPEKLQVSLLGIAPATQPTTASAIEPAAVAGVVDPDRASTRPATEKRVAGTFRIGQDARVLVRSPFPGQLLLTIETDRVVASRVIEMTQSSTEVAIPVTEEMRPNAYITATVVRGVNADAAWRAHRAFGTTRLSVDPAESRLALTTTTVSEMLPRQTLDVDVQVRDAAGQPVANAAVWVAAVDEGILRLTDFKSPDPLAFFWGSRALGVDSADTYAQLMPEVPKAQKVSAVGGDDAVAPSARHVSPVVARRVVPTALVSQLLRTDANGVVSAHLQVGQFIGSLRVMTVAWEGDRFGAGGTETLVRSPIIVQSSFPRFAAPGDEFRATLVVFNNTTEDATVNIRALAPDGDACPLQFAVTDNKLTAEMSLKPLMVRAGGQAQTALDLKAVQKIGPARIKLIAASGNMSFEDDVELAVRPPAPAMTRGGYMAATPASPAALNVPADMFAIAQSLQINVTPWPSLNIPQGLDYLERYPYGCVEQTTSGCFPLVYLPELGEQIGPGVFDRDRVAMKLQSGLLRLMGMQGPDGGLGMWHGGQSWSWGSIYAAHMVIEAEAAGHTVDREFRQNLLGYLQRQLGQSGNDPNSVECQTYACYVLALAGKPDRSAMTRLEGLTQAPTANKSLDILPQLTQARLHLAMAWMASGRKDLARTLLGQTLPTPRADRQTGGNIGSPIRDRALIISTLATIDPENAALPALVQELADQGLRNQWRSTQEVSFSIMAIGKYLKNAKKAEPVESAELLHGDRVLATAGAGGSIAWTSASTPPAGAGVPTGNFSVRMAGTTAARAYVAWLQNGIPMQPPANADNGLKVRRQYLTEQGAALEGIVQSSQLVKVKLTIVAPLATENIVIEDLLPAGLEIENPRLTTSAKNGRPREDDENHRIFVPAFMDVRDDRLVIVGRAHRGDELSFEYLARAVTPGVYVTAPVRAECMYDLGMNSIWTPPAPAEKFEVRAK